MSDFIYLFFSFTLVILDQISKKSALKITESLDITEFFSITLSFNKGISFGLFNNPGQSQIVLIVSNIIIIAGLLVYFMKSIKNKIQSIQLKTGLMMIISGAIGNLLDRFLYGHVIDFLDLHYLGYHWPIFNLADSFIVLGVLLLLLVEYSQTTQIKTKKYK